MHEELKQLNQKFGEAEKGKNWDFFDKVLSDELLFRRVSGAIHSKKQFKDALENTKLIYHEINTEVVKTDVAEDNLSAAVKAIVHAKQNKDGQDIEGYYMNIRFFKKETDGWKLVSWYNYEL